MSDNSTIYFAKTHEEAIIPARATPVAAGFDLYAIADAQITGGAGNVIVHTGISVKLPEDTYGRIAMRSGLAARHHLNVTAGVIDIDYHGEIMVLVYTSKLYTEDQKPYSYTIKKGERFAQLIVEKISYGSAKQVDVIVQNDKPHLGFGSTGTSQINH